MTSLTQEIPARITAWPRLAKAGMAFASGAIMVPAMPPWCFWPALFAGLGAFYLLLSSVEKARAGFAYGWLFGFGYFACGLSWIANALLVEGNEFAWVWPLAVAGLPALLAMFTAAACALIVRFARMKEFSGWLLFVFFLIGSEWLRGHLFTGFPWNLYGYTWTETLPVAQLASIGGIYWLSLLTCLWASLPGFLMVWQGKSVAKAGIFAVALLLLAAGYAYGAFKLAHNPTILRKDLAIRLVQPNIPQEEKWNPAKAARNLDTLLALSDARRVNNLLTTLIVWPETAISDYILQDTAAAAAIKSTLSGYDQPVYLLSGVMRYERHPEGNRYFNSLVLFDKRLNVLAAYDKSHLVPFGEYIPLQKWIPLQPFVRFSGFQPGTGPRSIPLPGIEGEAGMFSPLVCYEIIFPGAVTGKTARPGFIVNVTNDSWYGDSSGPRQHFAKARFRAIEEGLPVVRSANTGISGIIDPLGRVTYRQDLLTRAGNNIALPESLHPAPLYSQKKNLVFLVSLFALGGIIAILQVLSRLFRS